MQLLSDVAIDPQQHDAFLKRTPMATFLHTRRFLAYHGSRFRDVSLALMDERQNLIGVFPAAIDPTEEGRVVSHPGLTYGGLLHNGRLRGERMLEALESICQHYRELGLRTLRYKTIPYIYHQIPAGDDLYALFRMSARRSRCDLSSAIDLGASRSVSERRRRSLKKAMKTGVEIRQGPDFASDLWRVLEHNLATKYASKPVHTLSEITYLHSIFPTEIEFVVAMIDGRIEAGVVLFLTPRVVHAQYIASSEIGHQANALDAVFEHCISVAQAHGARYFDFGTSNEREGQLLNGGLYAFKTEFGGGGVAYETYDLNLVD
jgi:hypothetical protein